jgi:hypothetical protein
VLASKSQDTVITVAAVVEDEVVVVAKVKIRYHISDVNEKMVLQLFNYFIGADTDQSFSVYLAFQF